jgi:hypothetical protein
MNITAKAIVVFCTSLPLFPGCGTTALPIYASSLNAYASTGVKTAEQNGVTVSIDPFTDKERSEKFFALNAIGEGILILHLRVANKSGEDTWLLQKDQCKLILPGLEEITSSVAQRSTRGADTVSAIGAVAISVPLLMLGNRNLSKATEIQRNLSEKEIVNKTLSPSQMTEGFLYYRVDKAASRFTGELQVTLTSTGQRPPVILTIPVHYEKS